MERPIFETRFPVALIAIFCLLQFLQYAYCSEFVVGERGGWAVPEANGTEMYNHWASTKRFKVNDTLRFKYKKDSVMEVAKIDYNDCNSTRPTMFSNSGNTIFGLNRSGFFYFISGATGHCEKGQRMIVWVVGQDGTQGKTSDAASNNFLFCYGILFTFLSLHFVQSLGCYLDFI